MLNGRQRPLATGTQWACVRGGKLFSAPERQSSFAAHLSVTPVDSKKLTAAISLAKRELIARVQAADDLQIAPEPPLTKGRAARSRRLIHEVDAQRDDGSQRIDSDRRFVFKQENRRWSLIFCELQRSLRPSA
jgi:hypothetical protein